MKRRNILALTGSLLLAGCSNESPTDTQPRESATDTTTRTRTQESTASPTRMETDTPSLGVRHTYSFGEWHSTDKWNIAVQSLDLTTTFRVDDGESTYEMPDEKQLAIAPTAVENTTDIRRGWSVRSDFITNEPTVYESQMAFDHPEFENVVEIDELQQVDHKRQFLPEALPVDPGETARVWPVAVIPRSLSRQQIQVGMTNSPPDLRYPIRWEA